MERQTLVCPEPTLGYHPVSARSLTRVLTALRTVPGRQFDWGGRLRKSNGGVPRFPQSGRKPDGECKGRRELDCDTDGWSRFERRA